MKEKILISIHKEYVDEIREGKKRFEFRTIAPKKEVGILYIYETAPTSKVVGEIEVIELLKETPEVLWEKTKAYGCMSKEEFDAYYQDRTIAYAYHLGKATFYEKPKELSEFNLKVAPQSFAYIYN